MAEPDIEIYEEVEAAEELAFLHHDDQKLRAYVLSQMASADIDGRILVENMNLVTEWIKDGTMPAKAGSKNARSRLIDKPTED